MDLGAQISRLEQLADTDPGLVKVEDLKGLLNEAVLQKYATGQHQKNIHTSIESLTAECAKLSSVIHKQREKNEELRESLNEALPLKQPAKPIDMTQPVKMLANNYLTLTALGPPDQIEHVLLSLIEKASGAEWLTTPSNLPIVQFLITENLVVSETVAGNQGAVRIRLY